MTSGKTETPLRQAFNVCLGAYNRVERPGEWEAWTSFLSRYPVEVVGAAVMEAPAPDKYPGRMPTVGQLRSLVEGILARRRAARREIEEAEKNSEPPTVHASGNKDFDSLAAKLEKESIELGLEPHDRTPKEIAKRRILELQKLWIKNSPPLTGGNKERLPL